MRQMIPKLAHELIANQTQVVGFFAHFLHALAVIYVKIFSLRDTILPCLQEPLCSVTKKGAFNDVTQTLVVALHEKQQMKNFLDKNK
jgi:hypothetical protein